MHFDGFELCFLACFTATWQLLEGKFFEEEGCLSGPIFGTAARSQKWDRRLHLLSFLYNSLKTVPKTGPSGGPVFGASFDAF